VLIDTDCLATLPARELHAGFAEVIKYGAIRDEAFLAWLEASMPALLAKSDDALTHAIFESCRIKADVVGADEREAGERAILNFGHTFGHAIEAASNYLYSHGESVALGMVAASFAAVKLGMLDERDRGRITDIIRRAGLPTGNMELPVARVIDTMGFDKKVESGKMRFVLPDRIGHVVIRDDVPETTVREAIENLRK
jgi:3-dehydroquinate synthase